MSRKYLSILLLLIFAIGSVYAEESASQKFEDTKKSGVDKRNVLDYYKLLPENDGLLRKNLLESKDTKFTVKDIKNGYLKIEGAFEGWIEVALFRKKNGGAVILVGENTCGPACGTDLSAFRFIKGEMINVTEKVFPQLDEDKVRAKYRELKKDQNAEMISYLIELPQKGTTIKVNEDVSGDLIYEIKWQNDKFILVQ